MSQPEAFSRILIDKALEFSGWDLLNPQQVQFELHTGNGRADYLLKDSLGRVLCVLEAKREDLDPYDAKGAGPWLRRKSQSSVYHSVQRPRALVLELRAGRPARRLSHRAPAFARRPRTGPAKESSTAASPRKRNRRSRVSPPPQARPHAAALPDSGDGRDRPALRYRRPAEVPP